MMRIPDLKYFVVGEQIWSITPGESAHHAARMCCRIVAQLLQTVRKST
jgi:hypothetical protein